MNFSHQKGILGWKRIILVVAFLLIAMGVIAWFTTPREEDPRMKDRNGIITVIFPGATSVDVRRLVAKPLEDELAQVEGIKEVITKSRSEFVFFEIKLKDSIGTEKEIDDIWDDVEEGIALAKKKFPQSVLEPIFDRDLLDQDAALLAVWGTEDKLVLFEEAKELKDLLLQIPSVKKVKLHASPGEQLSVILDDNIAKKLGLNMLQIIEQIKAGNASIPSGYVRVGERKVNILTNSFFTNAKELSDLPIILKSGDSIALGRIAKVERTYIQPESESMTYNGAYAVGVGVVPEKNINLQQFGIDVRATIHKYVSSSKAKKLNIKINEVNFQPDFVDQRIKDIGITLIKAIVLVGGSMMLMLGLRVGALVAFQVPVVTAIAFGFFSMSGGVFHQISLVAFILAIGLLVDNVVVIVDGIQEKLDRGLSPVDAAENTVKEYWIPLLAGTITTIAAFVPMLLSKGGPADFLRSIGVVSTIALLISYFFCIFVTPIIATWFLKKGKSKEWKFVVPVGEKVGKIIGKHHRIVLVAAIIAIGISGYGFTFIKKQLFPLADRNQLIIDLRMPEGTHYKATLEEAKKIEAFIKTDKRVTSFTSFIGRGVPAFYYNLPRQPNSPHIAQIIVQTVDAKAARSLKLEREDEIKKISKYGNLIVREIAQGPPIVAPVEVRVRSEDPVVLETISREVFAVVRDTEGATEVRSDLGIGTVNIKYMVNDSASGNFGIPRSSVSGTILSRTRGLPITDYRGDEDPYSIVLRSSNGEESKLTDLNHAYVGQTRTADINIGNITQEKLEFLPSVVNYRDRVQTITIHAELAHGYSEDVVTKNVEKAIESFKGKEGYTVEVGGATKESADANAALGLAMPAGLFLILISLMFEFNSFRKIAIILVTIPLCAVGVVPGLLLSGSNFGLMTLFGCFALAGTVIHNGIFLLDYIDHKIREGMEIEAAIIEGVERRMRPIILTAVATIVELIPLTMSKQTVWPPFAWAIISGLSISTLLTLLVVPALYKVSFQKKIPAPKKVMFATTLLFLISLNSFADTTPIKTMTLAEVIKNSSKSLDASAARNEAKSVEELSNATWRNTFMPKLGGGLNYQHRDRDLHLATPFGNLQQGRADFWTGGLELTQPLIDPSGMLYQESSVKTSAQAMELRSRRLSKESQLQAIALYLQILDIRAKKTATAEYSANLTKRHKEFRRLFELGRIGESDLLKVKLGIDDANDGVKTYQLKEELLGRLLARQLNEDAIILPADLPAELPKVSLQGSIGDIDQREDLQAMRKQIESANLKAKSSEYEILPRIDAFASYTHTSQLQLVERDWTTVGLRMTWVGFDGGARYSKAASAKADAMALEQKMNYAKIAIRADMQDSIGMMDQKRTELKNRISGIKDAVKSANLEFVRLESGRSTVNDLLDAEELLRDRKEKADMTRVNWYQEWFRWQAGLGIEPSDPLGN